MRKLVMFLVFVALMLGIGGCSLVQPGVTTTVPNTTTQTPTTTTTQVPTTSGWEIVKIAFDGDNLGFGQGMEKFYDDEENEYWFGARKSAYIVVHYSNGTTENIRVALRSGRATLADLDRFGFQYYTVPKTS